MRGLRDAVVVSVLAAGLMVPIVAAEGLPVEIGVDLLRKDMTAREAKSALSQDAKGAGLSNRDGKKAVETLEKLIERGVPVNKAYEAVSGAVKRGGKTENLATVNRVAALKRDAAREEVGDDAALKGLKAEDVAVAVEVLDGLIERGVPVEKARDVVKEAVSEGREPAKLREMLTSERVERMKAAEGRGSPSPEAIGEKMRERDREKVRERISRPKTAEDAGGGYRR